MAIISIIFVTTRLIRVVFAMRFPIQENVRDATDRVVM